VLALDEVVKRFGHGTAAEVTALDGLSLEVAAGSFVTIIGSNGAGKSTLLRTILGTVIPERGRVRLDGRDVTREPVYRRARVIGRIAQDSGESTCGAMTVEENLAMAARRGQLRGLRWAVSGVRRTAFRDRLAEVGLGLETRLGTRVGTLSGGQRQALALLMATVAAPRLLLLDEHTASLDPKAAAQVMALTGRLVADPGLTTLMVTHNMQQAIRWGDRLIMMHAGKVVFDVAGAGKAGLTVPDLVAKFYEASGTELTEDRLLLA
jgi:putative ABC transport system ATP-binding protein